MRILRYRLNLCRGNEEETTQLCRIIRDDVYKKCLQAPEPSFLILTKAALDGLKSIDPMVDVDAFLTLFYKLNNDKFSFKESQCPLYKTKKNIHRQEFVHIVCSITLSLARITLRNLINGHFSEVKSFPNSYQLVF
ncbi:unnamed protein product [Trichogramma brassicae]|uniref:Uncharacterized protein n=1 Tax=Trichogramma brassicae TaxID=86971 RepID=A0A6H5I0E8_9HYME|nr:unnamed protein product [Trichogramma brassicae]